MGCVLSVFETDSERRVSYGDKMRDKMHLEAHNQMSCLNPLIPPSPLPIDYIAGQVRCVSFGRISGSCDLNHPPPPSSYSRSLLPSTLFTTPLSVALSLASRSRTVGSFPPCFHSLPSFPRFAPFPFVLFELSLPLSLFCRVLSHNP